MGYIGLIPIEIENNRKGCAGMININTSKHTIPIIISAIMTILLALSLPVISLADTGPKPSVQITVENPPDHICYATLLGNIEYYGPYQAVEVPREGEEAPGKEEDRAFNAFFNYASQDDHYFWGMVFTIDGGSFSWGYYPPHDFKVLIYDPETDILYVSDETSRYAFDSFYTISLGRDGSATLQKAPYFTKNLIGFFVRVMVTLAVEILIALLFGYRGSKEIRLIFIVNIITQVLLNLILSFADYHSGPSVWLIFLPMLEIGVFFIEAVVYAFGLKMHSKVRAVFYALVANLVTACLTVPIGLMIR